MFCLLNVALLFLTVCSFFISYLFTFSTVLNHLFTICQLFVYFPAATAGDISGTLSEALLLDALLVALAPLRDEGFFGGATL